MAFSWLQERLRPIPGYHIAATCFRLVVSRRARHDLLLRWRRPEGVLQDTGTTRANRYPPIFGFVRQSLGEHETLRLLSFGCSSGEEVFTLRSYFPAAFIKGIDVAAHHIGECRRRLHRRPDDQISFDVSESTDHEPAATYDAIFCMAVLRHRKVMDGDERCDHAISFASFDRHVASFARCLKPGGLLAIRHSNFRVCDSSSAHLFETVLMHAARSPTPLFGPDNRRLSTDVYPDAVFRKRAVINQVHTNNI